MNSNANANNNESSISSALPLPPMTYINLFNQNQTGKKGVNYAPPHPPSIPSANSDGSGGTTYSMFGIQFHSDDIIIRPLENQGIRRLYPQNFDHRRELKKLNHSILVNFLDLLEILIKCPEAMKRQEKIDDIILLFIHQHHLINEFRPHQARETLRVMMEVQKKQTLDTCERFQKHLEKSIEIIKTVLTNLPNYSISQSEHELSESSLRGSRGKDTSGGSDNKDKNDVNLTQDEMMCEIIDNL